MNTDGIIASAQGGAGFAVRLAPRSAPRRAPRKATRRVGRENRSEGKRLLVALDSDGTVLDSMAPKHEFCFGPAFADRFGHRGPYAAQGSARREAALEVWRFVNLGSRMRGTNRYKALARAIRLASRRAELADDFRREEPLAAALEAWLAVEPSPNVARLKDAIDRGRADSGLGRVLAWSCAVDRAIAAMPPARAFTGAAETLPAISAVAEIVVLTAAPGALVAREWEREDLGAYATCIAGQERGEKASSLAAAMEGRFAPDETLVIGDAPADLEAARAVGATFFPITPGREEESWSELASSFLPRFAAGDKPRGPVASFLAALASDPSWEETK